MPRFWWVRPADAVIVDGAEPLPPVWGDASAPDPAFRMTFAACLGYALKYPRKRAARPLPPVWAAPWRKADSPAKEALGGAMLRGISRRWRPLMGPKGGALPSVRLRLRLRKPSRSTDRGHAKTARMQAQETLSMGRAGLISADARTPAKRGRIKARTEARTGRSRMWGGKPCRSFKASAFGD